MKKLFVILLLCCAFATSFSQEVFFATGKILPAIILKIHQEELIQILLVVAVLFLKWGLLTKQKMKTPSTVWDCP